MQGRALTNKLVALLPIKANSERVNGKNFRSFNGKPLFRWILDTLLSLNDIEKIVINTDARDLLVCNGLQESERIIIRDRKPELCGDYTDMNLILADDIDSVRSDLYLMTHTTNPLLSAATIKMALNKLRENKKNSYDSLFSVNRFQSRFYFSDGRPVNHDANNLIPTQHLEPCFEENSNFYFFTPSSFDMRNTRIGNKPLLFETPRLESVDIDTEEDWQLAVATSKILRQKVPVL